MMTQCYAIYAQIPVSEHFVFESIYRFTTDKKTAKRGVKHLKKSGVNKANYTELNPTDWAIVLYLNDDTSKPFILNGGYRFYDSAYQRAEIVEQLFPQYLVSIQKFNETNVFAISEKEGLFGGESKGVFYA